MYYSRLYDNTAIQTNQVTVNVLSQSIIYKYVASSQSADPQILVVSLYHYNLIIFTVF